MAMIGGNGGLKKPSAPNVPHHQISVWPQWHENKPFALVLLLIGAFMIVYLNARIYQVQKETNQVGKPDPYEHQISVEGQGRVTGTPDIATVSLGVDSEGAEVAETQTKNSTVMNALIESMKALGIESKDLQTGSYSVYEDTEWNAETQTYEAKGWVVSQTLVVKIRDTAKIASVLDVAGKGGATSIYGPSFTIDDRSALKAEARKEAIADAKEKAVAMANELGVKLVEVVGFNEWEEYGKGYYDYALQETSAVEFGGGSPSIEAGSEEVILNINITYRLAD